MTPREEFLARVRGEMVKVEEGAAAAAEGRPSDPAGAAAEIRERAGREAETLLARFRAEAERLGVGVHRAATVEEAGEVVLGLAAAREVRRVAAWEPGALGPVAGVVTRLRAAGLAIVETGAVTSAGGRDELRRALAAAEMGVTGVDLAIAETGSLVLASGPGRGRAVSLLPPYHVAVFGRAQLVPGLAEAGVVLETWHRSAPVMAGANLVFVTGPSRTADIELTLTRGVHGPKEVHAVFVDAL